MEPYGWRWEDCLREDVQQIRNDVIPPPPLPPTRYCYAILGGEVCKRCRLEWQRHWTNPKGTYQLFCFCDFCGDCGQPMSKSVYDLLVCHDCQQTRKLRRFVDAENYVLYRNRT
jgi:hypothetical protein